ncbi:MAG: hypothetical protein KatS3mg104_1282 [Phycisphaerae bacterium]|jgi:hypothetical protein|nr:MAG: hypothetical protein KatS3mg104_1282 [Phycisphaerae bacterium]
MREIEFVPEWYTSTQRKRRLLKLQLACTVVLFLSLGAWWVAHTHAIEQGQIVLQQRQAELEASSNRVRERQEQDRLRAQYQLQEKVATSLGLQIESSRLLKLLEESLPKEASLLEMSIQTIERTIPVAQSASLLRSSRAKPEIERRLDVRFKGVCPTPTGIAVLLENLRRTGLVQDLVLEYARDRVDGDYLMHEFSLRFEMQLGVVGGES